MRPLSIHGGQWRPLLNEIFAAIHSDVGSNAPNGCIWLRLIEHSLLWFRAFFTTLKHHLVRTWPLDGFLNAGPHVVIIWDASPFGIGAVLCINGAIVEYIHATPSSFESDLLRLVRGDSESQQVMECLAGLVARRTWAHFWKKRKFCSGHQKRQRKSIDSAFQAEDHISSQCNHRS